MLEENVSLFLTLQASSAYLLCYTRRGESLQDNIHDEQRMEFDDSSTASSIESAPTPNGNGDEMT